ncbi:hypothetical protein VTL71DRAFT_9866 [Oculimacula yallundae]|uniref:Uncharacterized protein n=1 Tax=Oculimacula yallundae TaxID=86028 RepID=A0ABR4BQR9_9HELO
MTKKNPNRNERKGIAEGDLAKKAADEAADKAVAEAKIPVTERLRRLVPSWAATLTTRFPLGLIVFVKFCAVLFYLVWLAVNKYRLLLCLSLLGLAVVSSVVLFEKAKRMKCKERDDAINKAAAKKEAKKDKGPEGLYTRMRGDGHGVP